MSNDAAKNFARCDRGLVVGPAGCGKTHLIAEAVSYAKAKQLILTHTHAGVNALRTKLSTIGVPFTKYRVTTIDSLSLCYVSAFPDLAGGACGYPSGDEEWSALRVAACRLFRCRAPRRVLMASYAGMFVDEYQDCCGTQHAMLEAISEVLPCRIVGDPLQAIYRKLHPNDIVKWNEVERTFPVIDELAMPRRWRKTNPKLGEWLADVRSRLVRGNEVDFANADGTVKWISRTDEMTKIAECYKAFDKRCVVAICDWPGRCATVAAKTKNHFSVLESVECPDLMRAAEDIENCTGLNRVEHVVSFAQRCLTGMTSLTDLLNRMKKGVAYIPRSPDKIRLWAAMQAVVESANLRTVEGLMSDIHGLSDTHFFKRRELWQEMRRALRSFDSSSGRTLREVVWALRDHARRNGRRILSKRTVATPLLIKGLEFDHALLLDAMQMGSAEELYVALTRGSFSLTVLSSEPLVERSVPAWLMESSSGNQNIQQMCNYRH